MPITEDQRIARRKFLGSSDMAAVMGVSQYQTAYDIWLEKTGRLKDEDITSVAADAGNRFESVVLDWAEETLDTKLARNVSISKPDLYLAANLDAQDTITEQPVEAKTGGLFGPLDQAWGDPGTDQVPDPYIVQTHVQMILAGTDICQLAAFLGGRGFCMYQIHRIDAVADAILDTARTFWVRCVQADTPPENSLPTLEVIKRARRVAKKVVEVPSSLVLSTYEAIDAAKEAEEKADAAKATLLAAMGDAEEVVSSAGGFTYFTQSRSGLDAKALTAQFPDIAKQFAKTSTFPVLRRKKAK